MSAEGASGPHFGLVCITRGDAVRFRTVTRTRYLALAEEERPLTLRALYSHNLEVLMSALEFCRERRIRLYRMSANLFPLSDWEDGVGRAVLGELAPGLARFGARADKLGVRVVIHPEQFVVLNSEKPAVVANSVKLLIHYARILDALGLARSPWAAMNIHGGKGGRPDELVAAIRALPEGARLRLTLENDERAYNAPAILDVCERAGVPMVFDAHHHVVSEELSSLDDPSVATFTRLARETWTPPDWQLVHLSNGKEGVGDARHSDLIHTVPSAFETVRWVEVEAKGKEQAIGALRAARREEAGRV